MQNDSIKLRVTPAEGEAYDYLLKAESTIVGRSSTADLALSDPFLSRQHARLIRRDDTLMVEDLGSRNGTFVNGTQIETPTVLKPGDEVQISASLIELPRPEKTSISRATTLRSDPGATIFKPASELLGTDTTSGFDALENAESLRHYAEKLELLKDVHEALGHSMTQDDVLTLILDRTFDHLKPQQAVIYLKEDDGEFYQAATRALPGLSKSIPLSHTLVAEVLDKGMAALVFDVMTDRRFQAAESILTSGVRSMLAAPLLDVDGPMGMIVLNSTIAVRQFTEADMELLVSLASVAAMKIRNTALAEEAADRRTLQAQLDEARRIQVRLLPKELPNPSGYHLLGRNIPFVGVSGDFYQVVPRMDDTECVIFLADVSGKGMAASLLTMSIEALAAAPIEDGNPPDEICSKLSLRLYQRTPPEKYATGFVAVLVPETGQVTYTNAGHNSALLVHADGTVEELTTCGLPIGLMPIANYEARTTQLDPGSTLLIYTDGITEAENPEGEEYGLDRLRDCLLGCRSLPVEEMADAIDSDLADFAQDVPYADDRTLVIAHRLDIT